MPGIGGRDQHVCFLLLHRRCVFLFKLLMKAADTQLINLVFRSSEAAIKCWPLYFHMLPREDTQGPRQLVYIIGPPPTGTGSLAADGERGLSRWLVNS